MAQAEVTLEEVEMGKVVSSEVKTREEVTRDGNQGKVVAPKVATDKRGEVGIGKKSARGKDAVRAL